MGSNADADRFIEEFKARVPPPGDDALGRMNHALGAYSDTPDGDRLIDVTYNVYGDGVETGPTWGDLREVYSRATGTYREPAPETEVGE